jgi:hypothetical protein
VHNTAADAAARLREACRRAASAAAAAGQRVPSCQKGRGLQLRAWLIVGGASARLLGLKWAARAHQRAGSPVRRLRRPGWAARPTTVVSSGVLVIVGLGACALQPHGLSGSRVGGASEGAVVAAGGLGFGGQGHGPKPAGSWQL